MSHYKKSIMNNRETILYKNWLRELLFYDKIKELKKGKINLPVLHENKYILRYESRFMKRLPKQFEQAEITLSMLYNQDFYLSLLNKWKGLYFSIPKERNIIIKGDEMFNGQKDLKNYLAAVGLQTLGGETSLISQLNQKEIDKMKRLRLKKMIRKISNDEVLTEPNDAIKELDMKVKEAVKNYS